MSDGPVPSPSPDDRLTARLVAQVQDLGFDSARSVVDRFTEMFDRFQSRVGAPLWAGELRLPLFEDSSNREAVDNGLELPDASPGGRSSASLWLHNPTSSPRSALRFWSPGMATHDGRSIPGSAVAFDPAYVALIDADSSVEVKLSISVPNDASPGTYHAQVLVDGQPDAMYPITLNVVVLDRP